MPTPDDHWWQLRNIVLDAASPTRQPPPSDAPKNAVVDLVRQFISTNDDRLINEAAKTVALMKPGVQPEVAETHYWLVLDKS